MSTQRPAHTGARVEPVAAGGVGVFAGMARLVAVPPDDGQLPEEFYLRRQQVTAASVLQPFVAEAVVLAATPVGPEGGAGEEMGLAPALWGYVLV